MSIPTRAADLSMVPLALFSLGVCAFLLSADFSNYIDIGAYIPYGIFTGAIGLVIAGFLALRAGNNFGGTAFPILGAFFISAGFEQWFFSATEKMSSADLGWGALAWGVVLLLLAIAALGVPMIPTPGKILWWLLFVAFFFAWLAGAFHMDWARTVASIAGILAAILAWLGGFISLRMGLGETGP